MAGGGRGHHSYVFVDSAENLLKSGRETPDPTSVDHAATEVVPTRKKRPAGHRRAHSSSSLSLARSESPGPASSAPPASETAPLLPRTTPGAVQRPAPLRAHHSALEINADDGSSTAEDAGAAPAMAPTAAVPAPVLGPVDVAAPMLGEAQADGDDEGDEWWEDEEVRARVARGPCWCECAYSTRVAALMNRIWRACRRGASG
jgi:hypothetical protein